MELGILAETLHLAPDVAEFMKANGYDAAEARFDPALPRLQDEFLLAQYAKIGDRHSLEKALTKAAALARREPAVAHVLNFFNYYYYTAPFSGVNYRAKLPDLSAYAGTETAGLLMIAAALGAVPRVEATYAKLGLPPHYALDTVHWLAGAIAEFEAGHGCPGMSLTKPHWLRYYIEGRLFRVGRFEFMMQKPLAYLPSLWRRKSDGALCALVPDEWRLRPDGLYQWSDEDPGDAVKRPMLEVTEKFVRGLPIDPRGFAEVGKRVTLDRAEWDEAFAPDDLVPGLHIPGGGGMTPEACRASLTEALEFFPRYFGREAAGVSCFSWIFNPDFERELPQSNLADLMRQVYLFPFPSVGVEGLMFVFGKQDADWSRYPADNSLRKAFHRLREAGRRLKAGGMFLDAAGIRNYGTEFYRKRYERGV